ncbi:MAG: precorrin-4 C(11)-methyltransferase [Desulfovibrionaceae bacterium]|nr:precorrin-4 C(11)-methyltransferase [Desulfovibrionaceae bacterium]
MQKESTISETSAPSAAAGREAPTRVIFAGAGPGAADLVTLRARRALDHADLIVYAGSLINTELLASCRPDCRLEDSSRLTLEQQVTLMAEAARKGLSVVRLHSGDPTVYGAIREQKLALAKLGVETDIIPGVTSALAAAAALGIELTVPEVSQSIVLTRAEGRTPLPKLQRPAAFAGTGATLVFYLSAAHFNDLTAELMGEGNLAATTPCAVVNRVSWDDERVVRGTLKDIAGRAREAGIHRQALLLVGEALNDSLDRASLLYDASFSHGYRNSLAEESFEGPVAVLAFSARGRARARELCTALGPQAVHVQDRNLDAVWDRFAGIVCVGATGIAVRLAAPLLKDKARDPALVCMDDRGRFAVSLCGGHLAGANRLARRVARVTGGEPVVSTATDGSGLVAFDEAAAREGCRVLGTQAILPCNRALLEGRRVDFYGPEEIWRKYWAGLDHVRWMTESDRHIEPSRACVCWDDDPPALANPKQTLRISSRVYVLGTGCHSGVDPEVYLDEALRFLQRQNVHRDQLACVASLAAKGREPCVRALTETLGCPFAGFPSEVLDSTPGVVSGSAMVAKHMGTPSVCEAAALAAARQRGGAVRLVAPKESHQYTMTFALARIGHNTPEPEPRGEEPVQPARPEERTGRLVIAGLGSGQPDSLTAEARNALMEADVIAGYTRYVDYVRPLLEREGLTREFVESGMRGEIPRCQQALEQAARGKRVCLVCSGDPGLLAMAGLVLELRSTSERWKAVPVKILPGVSAAFLAAASLGAPLQNGAILLSLSDLLVPDSEVRRNLAAACASALPVAIYNPAGRRRRELLKEALASLIEARGADTLCALVRNAGQPAEERWVGRLGDLEEARVDMQCLLLVGGPRTRHEDGWLYEARGYADKYGDSLELTDENAEGKDGDGAD